MIAALRKAATAPARLLRRFGLSILAAMGLGLGAQAASTTSVDYTDIWWNAGESGWGAGLTMQDSIIFLTLFVQGVDRAPVYFSSDLNPTAAAQPTWSGTLYRSTGPSFGGPYSPAAVATAVGTASLRFASPGSGTLTYSVDGTTVTKAITRQTFRLGTLAGDYRGGLFARGTGCTGADGLGVLSYPGAFKVLESGNAVTIESTFTPTYAEGGSCRLSGIYGQEGRIASITQGTIACEFVNGPTPTNATFSITRIEFGENGFAGTYSAREGESCTWNGHFGGIRRGYPEPGSAPDTGPILLPDDE